MPDALLAAMPPILHALIEAGSGPILRPRGASRTLTSPPMMPGPRRTLPASGAISQVAKLSPISASTPSVIACPDRLVPAARKVTGRPCSRATASTARTSSSLSTTATTSGISR